MYIMRHLLKIISLMLIFTDFKKSAHSLTVFLLKAISCDNLVEVAEKNQYYILPNPSGCITWYTKQRWRNANHRQGLAQQKNEYGIEAGQILMQNIQERLIGLWPAAGVLQGLQ